MQNKSQIEFWNGDTGRNWVAHDALMEAMLQPIGETVLDVFRFEPNARALDIGCGCGHPTLSLAERIGAGGSVTGVDISAPMLAVAHDLTVTSAPDRARVDFLEVDAQVHPFELASVEHVFSRFGVMFFEDPVAAFHNLHAALTASGTLAFCCWQSRTVNPFMTVPAQAALELLPPPPEMPLNAPGPFAFAEPDYVHSILSQAGFSDISITPLRHALVFGAGLSLTEIVEHLVNIGPIAQMVRDAPEALQQPVRDRVANALKPFFTDRGGINLEGQFWQVTANA
ncbi:class I SAM-dependent methyltransferase [Luminiphilus sp.]|nr:class I SAM-dependent methyltransferase [Luminiphilus sp.]